MSLLLEAGSADARRPLPHLSVDEIEASGLSGRGGARFPTAAKLRRGARAVIANGAEGEPLSAKDTVLLQRNPQLVLDGLELAAALVDAHTTTIAVSEPAAASVEQAIGERGPSRPPQLVVVPDRFVAGEESALVSYVAGGDARPTGRRPYASGILVHNVETLAHLALVARHGAAWYRDSGTSLTTVGGAVARPGVVELGHGATLGELFERCGGTTSPVDHVLVGGYFGRWRRADRRVVPGGAPVVLALPADRCGLVETARIVRYLARESAGQCGPCVFGLPALAKAVETTDVERIERLHGQISRRGACGHPDGALGLVASALEAFEREVDLHRQGACSAR